MKAITIESLTEEEGLKKMSASLLIDKIISEGMKPKYIKALKYRLKKRASKEEYNKLKSLKKRTSSERKDIEFLLELKAKYK